MNASCSACAKKRGEAQLDIALWSGVCDGTKEYAYFRKRCSMSPFTPRFYVLLMSPHVDGLYGQPALVEMRRAVSGLEA